jgi:hypothetical protein
MKPISECRTSLDGTLAMKQLNPSFPQKRHGVQIYPLMKWFKSWFQTDFWLNRAKMLADLFATGFSNFDSLRFSTCSNFFLTEVIILFH